MRFSGSVRVEKYNQNNNVIDAREFQSAYKRAEYDKNKNKYKYTNHYSK